MTARKVHSPAERLVYHYTDADGYKAIAAGRDWTFEAKTPRRRGNPKGAYFTDLPPDAPDLCARIGISKDKSQFFLSFIDAGDLLPLNPDRPAIYQTKFYSPETYVVSADRQREHGVNPAWT